MTSSGLEWDYYEFEPVETSSLEYATPGANSLLLPANPVNSHWSSNAISDWSMSNHTAPTSEIVQDPVATVKGMKEEKNEKNPRSKARNLGWSGSRSEDRRPGAARATCLLLEPRPVMPGAHWGTDIAPQSSLLLPSPLSSRASFKQRDRMAEHLLQSHNVWVKYWFLCGLEQVSRAF